MTTLGNAVLGLLATGPKTGYDVARLMRAPISYMWTAHHSQIYPELARLEAEGAVESEVIAGPGPRDTKRYSITVGGLRRLSDWVDSPLGQETARSEFALRVRSMWLLPTERATAFIAAERRKHVDQLADYLGQEARSVAVVGVLTDTESAGFTEYATLRLGISRERMMIEWCDWLLAKLPAPSETAEAAGDSTERTSTGTPGCRELTS